MELFDGLQQYVKGPFTKTQGRYFLFNMASQKPLMVSLRSASDTQYRIVGRLTSWKEYVKSNGTQLYPTFADAELEAETTQLGSVALVVRTSDLTNATAKDVLLLSVFPRNDSTGVAEFRIDVTQHVSKLHISETKQGFVEKEGIVRYEIKSDGTKELIVHANSYNLYCIKLNLLAKYNGLINATVLSKSLTGELMISPSE